MATRKSFDEKSKGMHKSRKLIIDTVFGRTDNNQRVFGYEKEGEKKREVGERWTDAEGKEWEQKEGYIANVTKMDDVRDYLKQLTTCKGKDCKTIQQSSADKKLILKTGLCTTCLAKMELGLKQDGTFPFYEDYKITNNKLAYVRDLKDQYEDNLKNLKDHFEEVNENGTVTKWEWQVDINKVREDLKNDINGAYDAIEALLERKMALENKLRELNHPELIK